MFISSLTTIVVLTTNKCQQINMLHLSFFFLKSLHYSVFLLSESTFQPSPPKVQSKGML